MSTADPMTTLTLTTCTLRPWRRADAESLIWNADDVRVAAHLREEFPSPYTYLDAQAWLDRVVDASPVLDFAIEAGVAPEGGGSGGEAVGGIGLRLGADEGAAAGEIGYWLGHDYWRRGIATEAVAAVTRYGVERFGLARVSAVVLGDNPASERVLEKNGYVLAGQVAGGVPRRGRVVAGRVYRFEPPVTAAG